MRRLQFRTGQEIITRRGIGLVRIDLVEEGCTEIWDSAKEFKEAHGSIKVDFTLPARTVEKKDRKLKSLKIYGKPTTTS